MEDIFSNDENKKKAIKYVIDLGKTKNIHNSPRQKEERYKKSASPLHYQQGGTLLRGNVDSFKGTPNRTYYDGRGNNINTRINQTNNINNTGVGPNTISNFYPNPKIIQKYIIIKIDSKIQFKIIMMAKMKNIMKINKTLIILIQKKAKMTMKYLL